MKRNYYLWIAAAAAIVAGCAQENVLRDNVSESEQALITFDTYHSRATKAPIDNEEDLTYDNGGFGVYAFKHVDAINVTDGGIINLSAIADEFTNPVFDNTMTWFNPNYTESGDNPSPFFTKYIYEYPRYWDKQMNYTFFAYAPHAPEAQAASGDDPEVKGVRLDVATGNLYRNDVHQVQSACSPIDTTITNGETTVTKAKYKINEEDIIDYLLAPVVPGQRWHATNQTTKPYSENIDNQGYENAEITVGFELHHILSQLNVSIKAKNEENDPDDNTKNGHEYKGIKSIYVTKLEITNLPPLTNLDENFIECQQNKVDFAHIYAYSTFQPLTFTPGNYNNKSLAIVNPVTSTTYSIDGETATANPLYILAGGTDLAAGHEVGGTTVGGYIDQNFRYYVAPNLPTVTGDLHDLNIDYYIEYLDGKAEKYSRTIRLDTDTFHFDEMVASYIYNIGITISLDQIYITVDDVVWNTDPHSVNVSGDDL